MTVLFLAMGLGISAVLIVVENKLAKLENPLWGSIIPVLFLIGTILFFTLFKPKLEMKIIAPFVLFNLFNFYEWSIGRDKYKALKNAELEKMKAKDIY
jgi:hypothetical protein